ILGRYKPNLIISDDLIYPIRIEKEARYHPYWQTPQARELYRGLNRLRYGSSDNPITDPKPARRTSGRPGPKPRASDQIRDDENTRQELPLEVRRSLKWQYQLSDYLDELSKWKPENERDESDFFHQKCRIYNTLLKIAPKSYLSDKVTGEYLAFLTFNRFNRESFIEWDLHVSELVRYRQAMELEASESLIEAMRTCDDQVIRLTIPFIPYFEMAEKEERKMELIKRAY